MSWVGSCLPVCTILGPDKTIFLSQKYWYFHFLQEIIHCGYSLEAMQGASRSRSGMWLALPYWIVRIWNSASYFMAFHFTEPFIIIFSYIWFKQCWKGRKSPTYHYQKHLAKALLMSNHKLKKKVQLNFSGSNIFGTMEICSRYGQSKPLRINHGARLGRKWQ